MNFDFYNITFKQFTIRPNGLIIGHKMHFLDNAQEFSPTTLHQVDYCYWLRV